MKLNIQDFIYVDKAPAIQDDSLKPDYGTIIFIQGAAYFTNSITVFLNEHKPSEYIYYPKPLKYIKDTKKDMKMYRYPEVESFEDFVSLVTGIIENENLDVKEGDIENESN
jgi:hypothetical protein